jgi:hypothetical protein
VIGFREWQVGVAEVPELNFYHRPADPAAPLDSKSMETAYVPNPQSNMTAAKQQQAQPAPTDPQPAPEPTTANAPE